MMNAKSTLSAHTFRITRFAPLLALPLLLEACSTASYPSLARREAETYHDEAKTARQPQASQIQPAQLAALLVDARSADARFAALLARTETALSAARGTKAGDAPWDAANMQLAEMERARGNLGLAQGALDHIYADDRLARPGIAEDEELAKARVEVAALAEAEDKVLARLRPHLP